MSDLTQNVSNMNVSGHVSHLKQKHNYHMNYSEYSYHSLYDPESLGSKFMNGIY